MLEKIAAAVGGTVMISLMIALFTPLVILLSMAMGAFSGLVAEFFFPLTMTKLSAMTHLDSAELGASLAFFGAFLRVINTTGSKND